MEALGARRSVIGVEQKPRRRRSRKQSRTKTRWISRSIFFSDDPISTAENLMRGRLPRCHTRPSKVSKPKCETQIQPSDKRVQTKTALAFATGPTALVRFFHSPHHLECHFYYI